MSCDRGSRSIPSATVQPSISPVPCLILSQSLIPFPRLAGSSPHLCHLAPRSLKELPLPVCPLLWRVATRAAGPSLVGVPCVVLLLTFTCGTCIPHDSSGPSNVQPSGALYLLYNAQLRQRGRGYPFECSACAATPSNSHHPFCFRPLAHSLAPRPQRNSFGINSLRTLSIAMGVRGGRASSPILVPPRTAASIHSTRSRRLPWFSASGVGPCGDSFFLQLSAVIYRLLAPHRTRGPFYTYPQEEVIQAPPPTLPCVDD
jgi:hypothetical protein